ncbi:MAG: M14 family zinc carboxypeptidase [Candidatus Alcyoniella australis]|nr:M14 family zinc carboxypeptidase [Candidatus Alcyoniella australis]
MNTFKRCLLIALCLTLICALPGLARDYNFHPLESLVRVYSAGPQDIATVQLAARAYMGADELHLDFLFSPQQIEQLIDSSIAFDVLIEDYWGDRLARGLDGPPAEYYDYSEMATFLSNVATNYPSIAQLHNLGTSLGGRTLWALKISDNVTVDEAEPEIYWDSTTHGDEPPGTELLLDVINQMVTGYGTDWDMTALVDDLENWFVPIVNPDGHVNSSRYNGDSVDLNRDYGYMWESEGGSDFPYGEPESQAIANLWLDNQFSMGTSYHTGTTKFLWAWSYTYTSPPDGALMDYMGGVYCGYTGYQRYQGAGLYGSPYHGSSKDTLYGTFGSLGWTIEISTIKTPPYSQIPGIININDDGVFDLMTQVDTGIQGMVTDATSDAPVGAMLYVDPAWVVYSDPLVGDFFRVLRPGTYDVTAWAPGYQVATQQDVVVSTGSRTQVDLELTPQATPMSYGFRWLYSFMTNSESTTTLTIDALGPTDGGYVAIGNNGYAVIDLSPEGAIDDNDGDDVLVVVSDSEGYALYGSNTPWHQPSSNWKLLGYGSGTSSFDLDGSGLSSVRYLRVDNCSKGTLNLDSVGSYIALVVDFVGDPTQGDAPLSVDFTDMSQCLMGNITGWSWSFGDTDTSSDQNPSHVYQYPGRYTVQLTIDSSIGSGVATRVEYIVVDQPGDDDDDDDDDSDDDDDDLGDDDDDASGDDDDDDQSCCG